MLKEIKDIITEQKLSRRGKNTLEVVRYSKKHPEWFVFLKEEYEGKIYYGGHFPLKDIDLFKLIQQSVELKNEVHIDTVGYSIMND